MNRGTFKLMSALDVDMETATVLVEAGLLTENAVKELPLGQLAKLVGMDEAKRIKKGK